jgi:hypothetical protein
MTLIAEEQIGAHADNENKDNKVCQIEGIEPVADGGVGNVPHPLGIFTGVHYLF